jgi:hypothetical protein
MAKFQEALDLQIETLGLAAMDTLRPEKGEHIIDIGCGCGQTSLDLGSRVGAGAQSHRLRNIDTDASRRSIQWRLGPLHSSMRAVLGWLPLPNQTPLTPAEPRPRGEVDLARLFQAEAALPREQKPQPDRALRDEAPGARKRLRECCERHGLPQRPDLSGNVGLHGPSNGRADAEASMRNIAPRP